MKSRIIQLDFLRGIAILVVLFGHALQVFYNYIPSFFQKTFEFIQFFQMPLLMLISGFAMSFSFGKRSVLESIKRKNERLFLPYFVWATLNYALSVVLDSSIKLDLWSYIHNIITSQFWFLRHLYIYSIIIIFTDYLIQSATCKMKSKVFVTSSVGMVFVVAVLSKIPVLNASFNLWYYIMFVLGLVVGLYKIHGAIDMKRINKYSVLLTQVAFFLISLLFGNTKIIGLLFIACIIASINCIPQKVFDSRIMNSIASIGSKTLYIYAIHWILGFKLLQSCNIIDWIELNRITSVCMVLLVFGLFLLESLVLGRIFKKNRYLSKMLLGE